MEIDFILKFIGRDDRSIFDSLSNIFSLSFSGLRIKFNDPIFSVFIFKVLFSKADLDQFKLMFFMSKQSPFRSLIIISLICALELNAPLTPISCTFLSSVEMLRCI